MKRIKEKRKQLEESKQMQFLLECFAGEYVGEVEGDGDSTEASSSAESCMTKPMPCL